MKRLLFVAIIFLSSCTSLNKVVSTTEKSAVTNEYAYTDQDSQIRYSISNDDKNLHIRMNSTDVTTISKIFKTGLKICFDLNGKKSKSVYFEYPLAQSTQPLANVTTKSVAGVKNGAGLTNPAFIIPTEGEFNRNGVKEQIQVASKESDIKASIRKINDKEIVYDLIIPLKRISPDGILALAKLSVGVVSGKSVDASSEDDMGGGPGGPGGGGMEGGGPPPGGGGMDGGGGPPPGGFGQSSSSNTIDFWFKLTLQK